LFVLIVKFASNSFYWHFFIFYVAYDNNISYICQEETFKQYIMNEDLLKMQSEMIEDLRKMVKDQELEIEHLVGRKLDLESQVRILTKKNSNLNY
jgi:hypothetical protein